MRLKINRQKQQQRCLENKIEKKADDKNDTIEKRQQ